MKPFENAQVGDLVYLPNDLKGKEIFRKKDNSFAVLINGLTRIFDLDGRNILFPEFGQIIFPTR